jgi:hypothetical protein
MDSRQPEGGALKRPGVGAGQQDGVRHAALGAGAQEHLERREVGGVS